MPQNPDRITRMWQELKRRKVFRVFATYCATAYIIIEVTNNIIGPLHLPEWTATLVILLLALGLPVTVILAWLFDITPEGIKKTEELTVSGKRTAQEKPAKRGLKANDIVIVVLMVIVVLLAFPRIFGRDKREDLRSSDGTISLAVMPFRNMTNDPSLDEWQVGIQVNLITSLSNSEELKVKQTESVNNLIQSKGIDDYASVTPSVASKISKKLGASVFICGTIKKAGTIIRINAQLTNSKTEDALKSFQIDGSPGKILNIIDSLSGVVKNAIIITQLEKTAPYSLQNIESASSLQAYSYFIFGNNSLMKFDYSTASKWYTRAVEADTNLTFANILLSLAYANQGLYEEAKKWCLKAYDKREQMDIQNKIWTNYIYAVTFETPNDEIKYLRQLKEINDRIPDFYYYSGLAYIRMYEYDKAIPELEKALEIYSKMDSKPFWAPNYTALGSAYHNTGQFKKERKLYKKAEKYFPDDPVLLGRKAVLALSEADTVKAESYISEYISAIKRNLSSESDIASGLAEIYSDAGVPGKAEKYFRQALSSESDNPDRMNDLSWFLIEKNRDIEEGLSLIDKALEMNPQNYLYLDCKAWGLYKQGKISEALGLIEKSWDLRPVYDHRVYLHKQTIESHKN
jgi:tetratricopeptide (TPR) repeat protein